MKLECYSDRFIVFRECSHWPMNGSIVVFDLMEFKKREIGGSHWRVKIVRDDVVILYDSEKVIVVYRDLRVKVIMAGYLVKDAFVRNNSELVLVLENGATKEFRLD